MKLTRCGLMTVTAIALAAVSACSAPDAATAPKNQPPGVTVITVAPAAEADAFRASGLVLYKRETALAFNLPGVIATISVDEGQTVRAGQQLAALRLTAVQAGATEATAALETAERNLARQQTLFERGLIAQARLDDAALQVQRARAASDAAGFNRDTAVLTAPAAGVILRRQAEPAQVVGPGQPVLLLGESAQGLIVRASVTAAQAARLERGAPARVSVASEPAPRVGRVTLIAAKSDAATGVFDIEVRLENPAGLRSGMVAQVDVETARPSGSAQIALAVPLLALLDARADQGVVYVVDDQGVARRRSIRTGGVIDETVVVLEGLQAGERVIAAGAAFVRDGEQVSPLP